MYISLYFYSLHFSIFLQSTFLYISTVYTSLFFYSFLFSPLYCVIFLHSVFLLIPQYSCDASLYIVNIYKICFKILSFSNGASPSPGIIWMWPLACIWESGSNWLSTFQYWEYENHAEPRDYNYSCPVVCTHGSPIH